MTSISMVDTSIPIACQKYLILQCLLYGTVSAVPPTPEAPAFCAGKLGAGVSGEHRDILPALRLCVVEEPLEWLDHGRVQMTVTRRHRLGLGEGIVLSEVSVMVEDDSAHSVAGRGRPPVGKGPDEEAIDRELAIRAAADPEAFAALYDRYVERVYSFAYRRLGSRQAAEDVTAETFLRALSRISEFSWRGGGFGAWVFRIARNLCWDMLREGRRTVSLPVGSDDPPETGEAAAHRLAGAPGRESDPEEQLLRQERLRRLRTLVDKLPDHQYEVILLKYAAGLKNREIAAITGKSETAVSSLLNRTTAGLRERYGERHAW